MRTIELSQATLTISELLELAENDTVIIKKADGREFVLCVVDDFAAEVKALQENQEFMDFLACSSFTFPQCRCIDSCRCGNVVQI
jgi:hypothetical protein